MRRPPPLRVPGLVLPPVALSPWTGELWRIQNGPTWTARSSSVPRFRFDALGGEYTTVYASGDALAAFAEVYRDRGRRLGAEDGRRYLVRLVPVRPLPLVDLRDPLVLLRLGLDERITVGDDYRGCQAWSGAFHDGIREACGICYRSRLAGGPAANAVLFADRCATDVRVVPVGRLCELEPLVLAAADRYDLIVAFGFA